MDNDEAIIPPPLQGCLYCHSEGTTRLSKSHRFLIFGGSFPTLKCSHCKSVADFDSEPLAGWRIRYRKVNRSPRYYYSWVHFGKMDWMNEDQAIATSTDSFAQRQRVVQAKSGNLSWLRSVQLPTPLPMMSASEQVLLTLRAVTLRETLAGGFLTHSSEGIVLDSGKLYVTDRYLHLVGQRRDWSYPLRAIGAVTYDETTWTLYFDETAHHFRGMAVRDQFDPQLIAAILDAIR